MTNYQLEQRCLQVIEEATTRVQAAPTVQMREKWQVIKETWLALLKKTQATTEEEPSES